MEWTSAAGIVRPAAGEPTGAGHSRRAYSVQPAATIGDRRGAAASIVKHGVLTRHRGIGPASSAGSRRRSKRLILQSRCGPVERPLVPTSARS